MSEEINFKLAEELASEESVPVSAIQFVNRLLKKYDEERHLRWDRTTRQFVRCKCALEKCKETKICSPGYGD